MGAPACRELLSAVGAITAHIGPLEWAGTLPAAWTHIVSAWHAALRQPAARAADVGDVTAAVRRLQAAQPAPLFILVDPLDSSMDPAMLQAILSLPSLAREPIGIVLVSTLPWVHLYEQQEPLRPRPLSVHFPAYATSDILAILASERPLDVPAQLYESVLRGVVKPAVHASRQLRDARTLAAELLPTLRHVHADGGGDVAQAVARLKAECKPLTDRFSENYSGCTIDLRRGIAPSARLSHTAPTNKTLEVPYLGKFLILAAFLAASNRASADRRAMSAGGGSRSRKRKDTQASDRQAEAAKQESLSQGQARGAGLRSARPAASDHMGAFSLCSVQRIIMLVRSGALRGMPCRCSAPSAGCRSFGSSLALTPRAQPRTAAWSTTCSPAASCTSCVTSCAFTSSRRRARLTSGCCWCISKVGVCSMR